MDERELIEMAQRLEAKYGFSAVQLAIQITIRHRAAAEVAAASTWSLVADECTAGALLLAFVSNALCAAMNGRSDGGMTLEAVGALVHALLDLMLAQAEGLMAEPQAVTLTANHRGIA